MGSLATYDFLCLPQTVTEELGEGELPREMFVIGEDLNIRPKLLQQVIDEVGPLSLSLYLSHIQQTNQLLSFSRPLALTLPHSLTWGSAQKKVSHSGTSLVETTLGQRWS